MEDIHDENQVKRLFGEMARTYGVVNIVSSLGFAWFWRRQAARSLPRECGRVCDLMTGGAECLGHIKSRAGAGVEVDLVDWCEGMCARAEAVIDRRGYKGCRVIQASALQVPVDDARYDAVVSTFGLKTLAPHELALLAKEVSRILKPGGSISLLEFSMPRRHLVRFLFRIYVQFHVPLLGAVFLGNPDNYRMLWRYTREFEDCRRALEHFRREGFEVRFVSHFFGSATQIVGTLGRG